MYCLRWWIPLFLLPFPSTTPFFLILFLVSFALHSQPCMYCALILTGLFATSSNWYGPNSNVAILNAANSSVSTTTSNATHPRLSYGWLDLGLNSGKGFFSPLSRLSSSATAIKDAGQQVDETLRSYYHLSVPWSQSGVQIPKRFYLGLGKHQGLGVWVDLGSGTRGSSSSLAAARGSTTHAPASASSTPAEKHLEL